MNSTIACALVGSKLGIAVIHVEAGLRSFDRSMPEEINRVLTDAISDMLFTTEKNANANLRREGIPGERIHFVGNVMIDTLLKHRAKAKETDILHKLGLLKHGPAMPYATLTLHRPSNVDERGVFEQILQALAEISKRLPILFPVHPRTLRNIDKFGYAGYFRDGSRGSGSQSTLSVEPGGIYTLEPLGYLEFLHLMSDSSLILTDSGGIQEESTILGVPCVTIRENTERPVTVSHGTNVIAGTNKESIIEHAFSQLARSEASRDVPTKGGKGDRVPPLWDGRASERIVEILAQKIE